MKTFPKLSCLLVACLVALIFPLYVILAEKVEYGERIVKFGKSQHDRKLKQRLDSWYESQWLQDCDEVQKTGPAIDALRRAFGRDPKQYVHGPSDSFNRKDDVKHFRFRRNPKGEGTIVHGWIDSNRSGSADYRRLRFVWLVLDNQIYPLNVNASGALSRLFDGLPKNVQRRSGLIHTYKRVSKNLIT